MMKKCNSQIADKLGWEMSNRSMLHFQLHVSVHSHIHPARRGSLWVCSELIPIWHRMNVPNGSLPVADVGTEINIPRMVSVPLVQLAQGPAEREPRL